MGYAQSSIPGASRGPGMQSHQVSWALAGLGRSYYGEPPGSPTDWNRRSASGAKTGVASWGIKAGSKYSSPSDVALAQDVYRFQHDVQNCAGPNDPSHRGANCVNRDGMLGKKTACLIANAIRANTEWGQHWNRHLSFERNFDKAGTCSMNCADVACNQRANAGCQPCSGPGPGPGPGPNGEEKSNLPMILGGLAVIGLGWWVLKGKKGSKVKRKGITRSKRRRR